MRPSRSLPSPSLSLLVSCCHSRSLLSMITLMSGGESKNFNTRTHDDYFMTVFIALTNDFQERTSAHAMCPFQAKGFGTAFHWRSRSPSFRSTSLSGAMHACLALFLSALTLASFLLASGNWNPLALSLSLSFSVDALATHGMIHHLWLHNVGPFCACVGQLPLIGNQNRQHSSSRSTSAASSSSFLLQTGASTGR